MSPRDAFVRSSSVAPCRQISFARAAMPLDRNDDLLNEATFSSSGQHVTVCSVRSAIKPCSSSRGFYTR